MPADGDRAASQGPHQRLPYNAHLHKLTRLMSERKFTLLPLSIHGDAMMSGWIPPVRADQRFIRRHAAVGAWRPHPRG